MQRNNLSVLEQLPLEIQSHLFLFLSSKDLLVLSLLSKNIQKTANKEVWFKLFAHQTQGPKTEFNEKMNYKDVFFSLTNLNYFYVVEKNLQKYQDNRQKAFASLFHLLLEKTDLFDAPVNIIQPLVGALLFEKHITKHEMKSKVIEPFTNTIKYIAEIEANLDHLLKQPIIMKWAGNLEGCLAAFTDKVSSLPQKSNEDMTARWPDLDILKEDSVVAQNLFEISKSRKENVIENERRFSRR